ncbi:TetR/AcrR family transcriptional regulator [Nocardioides humilatus]|uniref:TetR/AcrR family transcriptional regulator n=1 Tax=Nocardioides humilatus TaxID=2607660 RepID=A0A5B1LNI9_9ACTN|nr:TetR/AcrR family transcriptional regulator [Nocardioides humilatus]KAA1421340.1 TetR/AcrR family transcriptional regulator [Nocardioides humilatus]
MSTDTARDYAGQDAAARASSRRTRLLAAGLEVLGTDGATALTVRRALAETGLAPRYFYESFASTDALQVAVFEQVLAEVEDGARRALESAPRRARARIRAVLLALCEVLLDDPRKGRIVLVEAVASPALGPLRLDAAERFAGVLAEFATGAWRGHAPDAGAVVVTSQFAVGGMAETLARVLAGRLDLDRDVLVDHLTELLLGTGVAFKAITS